MQVAGDDELHWLGDGRRIRREPHDGRLVWHLDVEDMLIGASPETSRIGPWFLYTLRPVIGAVTSKMM